jgi:hypothetical protein
VCIVLQNILSRKKPLVQARRSLLVDGSAGSSDVINPITLTEVEAFTTIPSLQVQVSSEETYIFFLVMSVSM